MPADEREALGNACLANDQALRASGRLLAVEGLQSSRTAITVRLQHGGLSVSDGPYAEAAEQLIGIFTIDARDLNEAIQVAACMPQACAGPIEVRPIMILDQLQSPWQNRMSSNVALDVGDRTDKTGASP
jgi:hypothetical protein